MAASPATLDQICARWLQDEVFVKTRPNGSYFSAAGGPPTPAQFQEYILGEVKPYRVNGWPEIDVNDDVVKAKIDLTVAIYAGAYYGWARVINNDQIAPWQVEARKDLHIV